MSLKIYIGCKIIEAAPMDLETFNKNFDKVVPAPQYTEGFEGPIDGYMVRYPDGYVSWSPKGVFERAYRPVHPDEDDLLRDNHVRERFGAQTSAGKEVTQDQIKNENTVKGE